MTAALLIAAWGLSLPALAELAVALAMSLVVARSKPVGVWRLARVAALLQALAAGVRLLGYATLADLAHVASGLAVTTACLTPPLLPVNTLGRLRAGLDAAIVSGVSIAIGWLVLLSPLLLNVETQPAQTLSFSLYALIDLALLVALLTRWALAAPPVGSDQALAVAASALALADIAFTFLAGREVTHDGSLYAFGRWGVALIALWACGRAAVRPTVPTSVRPSVYPSVRPYLPLAAVLALLGYVVSDWQARGEPNLVGLWLACVCGLAYVARQGVSAGERQLRAQAQLVEAMAEPAFLCDREGRIVLANPALARAVGRDAAASLVGSRFFDWMASTERPVSLVDPAGHLTAAASQGGWTGEVTWMPVSGEPLPVALSLRALPGEDGLLAGVAHDLSATKRQQAQLQAAVTAAATARAELELWNAQLETLVDQKTADLQHANVQLADQNAALQQLDQLKTDFVALVSHELRAPLTNINGGIELALHRADIPARTREHLGVVQAEITRLTAFVESILDLSALESGRLPLTLAPLDLHTLGRSLLAPWRGTPAVDRIRLDLPPDLPPVLADERGLRSVLIHLIDNALKYAPESRVDVFVDAERWTPDAGHRPSSSVHRLCVRDHGPGIPPEQRTAIFERFRRLHNADDRHVYGHGLGLYQVAKFVAAQNATLSIEDTPGGGATFVVALSGIEVSGVRYQQTPDTFLR